MSKWMVLYCELYTDEVIEEYGPYDSLEEAEQERDYLAENIAAGAEVLDLMGEVPNGLEDKYWDFVEID